MSDSVCQSCGEDKPEYSHYLCVDCTARELVAEKIAAWMLRLGAERRLSPDGVNLYAGFDHSLREQLLPAVYFYLRELPQEHFPQRPPKYTVALHHRPQLRFMAGRSE